MLYIFIHQCTDLDALDSEMLSFDIEITSGSEVVTSTLTVDVTGANDAPQITNTNFSVDENSIAGTVVGRRWAGDWAFIPWSADSTGTNCDIDITPSASNMTLEYMLFTDD